MTLPSAASHPIDHVAVAVHSIEEAHGLFELLTRERCSSPELLESQGARVAFVGMIELIEPLGPDTHVGRFLARRGQALHHVALRTDDLEGELSRLASAGVRLIDSEPRRGARGHLVAFVHPSETAGILTELVQRVAPAAESPT